MKLIAGMYKIPEMFPKNFSFPGGYKITNLTDETHWLKLYTPKDESLIWGGDIPGNDSVCLYLEEGQFLEVKCTHEIVPYDPDV